MNIEREKALDAFIESGALATNMCPDFLRDAYHNAGFDAGVKAERQRIMEILEIVEPPTVIVMSDWMKCFPNWTYLTGLEEE